MSDNRILLVDPFKNLLNAYRIILEDEKYLVETTSSLKDAYELLYEGQYSVIITEYIPPFETTEYMIQWVKEKSAVTYIIMVSNAFVDERTYERLFAIGLDDFILKPYSPDKVLVHIKKGLRQRDLMIKMKEFERLSVLEPVTKEIRGFIFNAIYLKTCLRQEIKKAKRHHRLFSLLLIQMPTEEKMGDRFYNFYVELVRIFRKYTREEDMVGKNNGEIGIILPETDQIGSQALIQRLLNLIHTDPQFSSDDVWKAYAQTLSFQSFTYPDQFAIPESLKAVLEY
ncbi:MAG: nitrogen assimilation regulatory protein NtrX [Deltaproteobacteria bacterium]|jgi:DNA-binding response OmpR family regulator|nr:nitrogen assimilation regulatory protein NtrX [Deltaproteobacteria bacterium]